MKATRLIYSILFSFIFTLFAAPALAAAAVVPVLPTALVLMVSSFIPTGGGITVMAIQKEIWQNFIAENLWKDNSFLNYCVDNSQYVLVGKVVHIPQAGSAPSVEKNRSQVPAQVIQRTDTDITYALDEYTSDPVYIPNADTVELSYDKISSVMGDIMGALRESISDHILYHWGPATNIARTRGGSVAGHLTGTTGGTRKKFVLADVKAVQLLLDKQSIPSEDRYAIASADMINQLTDEMTASTYRDFIGNFDMAKGVVGEVYGFKFIKRGSVLIYDNTATPVKKAVGAAAASTDNDCVLFFQKQAVEKAVGEIVMFENRGDATYYGDIYSALVRMGGRIRRSDEKGIYALVQTLLT